MQCGAGNHARRAATRRDTRRLDSEITGQPSSTCTMAALRTVKVTRDVNDDQSVVRIVVPALLRMKNVREVIDRGISGPKCLKAKAPLDCCQDRCRVVLRMIDNKVPAQERRYD
jgi:hypothetical protein